MTRVALLDAIKLLPRFTKYHGAWDMKGDKCIVNHVLIGKRAEKHVYKIMSSDDYLPTSVQWIDTRRVKVVVLHRSLLWRSLNYLAKQDFAWQKWPKHRLPSYLKYKGMLIIWNGTHRLTLCEIANRKIKARVIDLDAYLRGK